MTATTDSAPAAARPRQAPRAPGGARVLAVDATRGVALAGMMAIHSLTASTPDGDPTLSFSLFAGRASAAYAVLAGISIVFITGRRRLPWGPTAAGRLAGLVVRAFLIGAIGLLLGAAADPEYAVVILPYYAVLFLVAAPLTMLRTRHLAMLVPVLAVVAPIVSQLVRPHLQTDPVFQLTFDSLVETPGHFLETVLFTGEFPAVVWFTYVIAGMVVGRLDLQSVRVATGLLATGLTMMVVAPVTSWFLLDVLGGRSSLVGPDAAEFLAFGGDGVVPTDTWWWLAVDVPHSGATLDVMATVGSTLAVLGALLLLRMLTTGVLGRVVRLVMLPFVAAGAMSLTAYVGHILFINSDFDTYGPAEGYIRQLVVIGLAAVLWRMTAGRGPLEGFIRACTRRADRRTRELVQRKSVPKNRVS